MAELALARGDGVEIGELSQSLGFLLRLAQIREFERFFEAFAGSGLSPGAFSILLVIHRNPGLRQGLLARALSIKPANMTKTVRALEDRGFVTRAVPEDDRRAVELRLTRLGTEFLSREEKRFRRHEKMLPPGLTAQEARMLAGLLRKMTGLDGPEERS